MNNIECKKLIFLKCFIYFVKDYLLFFSIFEFCNGKEKCVLGYNDMYKFVLNFFCFCIEIKGEDFYLLRIGVFNDCFYCMYYFVLK